MNYNNILIKELRITECNIIDKIVVTIVLKITEFKNFLKDEI